MSSLYLQRHVFQKKPTTFYNITLSSLRTIKVPTSREEGNKRKPQSKYLNLGQKRKKTEDMSAAIKMASSQEWLASSQN